MPKREIFLCHHSKAARRVHQFANELQLRGIAPWVDKLRGGFALGDNTAQEAYRVITRDCFGMVVYATPGIFDRTFIQVHEIPAALDAKRADAGFVLTTFADGVKFADLQQKSKDSFKVDLSQYHSAGCPEYARAGQRHRAWQKTARQVLEKWLSLQDDADYVSVQLSTRQLYSDCPQDILRFNAVEFITAGPYALERWDALRVGLVDAQREVTNRFGRPRLSIHGSKHLTAAFMMGRVFARNLLDIRQSSSDVWQSDAEPAKLDPFDATLTVPGQFDQTLFVSIASGHKNIAASIDAVIDAMPGANPARLTLIPKQAPLNVDNAICVAMVNQAYQQIERAVATIQPTSIHLFVAAHQSFTMMLGQKFSGMPEVHFYEWTGSQYVKSSVIPAGALT